MKSRLLLLILVLCLSFTSNLQLSDCANAVDLQLGYSPTRLFDTNLGTPTYVPGESIWVFSSAHSSVTLSDPSGKRVAAVDLADSPLLIYKFRDTDTEGAWTLTMRRLQSTWVFPVYFLKTTLKIKSAQHNFSFSASNLTLSGNFTLAEQPEFPVTVVLARRESQNLRQFVW